MVSFCPVISRIWVPSVLIFVRKLFRSAAIRRSFFKNSSTCRRRSSTVEREEPEVSISADRRDSSADSRSRTAESRSCRSGSSAEKL